MGNLREERGGTGGGKHLNLQNRGLQKRLLTTTPVHVWYRSVVVGKWVVPAALCSGGIGFDAEGPWPSTHGCDTGQHPPRQPLVLRKCFWHLTNIFLLLCLG